jgi:hypothetical protein
MSETKVTEAVARVAKKKQKAVVLAETTIRIAQEPIVVRESGDLSFTRGADPTQTNLLLWDPQIGAFRAVLTPAGSSWELMTKRQGPQLWKPGQPT